MKISINKNYVHKVEASMSKNQKNAVLFGVFLIACIIVTSCASGAAVQRYNNDLVMGLVWQQNSGEYAALCYQAFNAGKNYIKTLSGSQKRAAVLDIDETVLDNSEYAAWMVKSGEPWGNDTWEAWCNAAEAGAVPGALDFTLFLQKNNIEVFYVSNRSASARERTVLNMKNIGFPNADNDHILLMENTSDKNPRIETIKTSGYTVVLFAGDSLEDFDSSIRRRGNKERVVWADKQIANFGAQWIVLPNAVYGTFESAIVQNYYGLPPAEKAAARLNAITAWENN